MRSREPRNRAAVRGLAADSVRADEVRVCTGLEEMIRAEVDLQPYAWLSEDHEEGKLAFREKRRPRFKGR